MICHLPEQTVHFSNVINQPACSKSNLKMDVACMAASRILALKVQESKRPEAGFATPDTMKNVQQLAGYMLSDMAFRAWGVVKSKEPIVGLLVYPSAIYRLSLWKPDESADVPLGLRYKLEFTEDPLMMGWFLETLVQDYEADYLNMKRMESTLDFEHVDPADWTCLNFKFGTPLGLVSATNSEFLFESDGERLLHWIGHVSRQHSINRLIQCEEIPMGERLIVKYLSALAVDEPRETLAPIMRLVEEHSIAQQLDALDRQKDAEREAELAALIRKLDAKKEAMIRQKDAEIAELMRQIAEKGLELGALDGADKKAEAQSVSTPPSPESILQPEIAETALKSEDSNDDLSAGIAETKSASIQSRTESTHPNAVSMRILSAKFCFHIKHPYIAVMTTALVHPFLIMRDVGTSLAVMSAHDGFLDKWKSRVDFRRKFKYDIGISALNLVEDLILCHNDIRLSNIAIQDDSFCLIGFDKCRSDVPIRSKNSLVLRRYDGPSIQCNMMYTIAQIGVVVFALDTGAQAAEVQDVYEYWLTAELFLTITPKPERLSRRNLLNSRQRASLAKFDAWLKSKGRLVEKVFSETVSAAACGLKTRKSKSYFVSILDAMLA
jgi:hypothetical protein